MIRPPPKSPLFPSPTLFRSRLPPAVPEPPSPAIRREPAARRMSVALLAEQAWKPAAERTARDRKSTRLNSSHSQISYAVFCLKKKKNDTQDTTITLA